MIQQPLLYSQNFPFFAKNTFPFQKRGIWFIKVLCCAIEMLHNVLAATRPIVRTETVRVTVVSKISRYSNSNNSDQERHARVNISLAHIYLSILLNAMTPYSCVKWVFYSHSFCQCAGPSSTNFCPSQRVRSSVDVIRVRWTVKTSQKPSTIIAIACVQRVHLKLHSCIIECYRYATKR